MNDDWRLQVDFCSQDVVDELFDRRDARKLEDELSDVFFDRVVISRNGLTVFLYAGDRDHAEDGRALVEEFAQREGEELRIDLRRWHPLVEEWRPADEPLPEGDAAEAQRQARIAKKHEEAKDRGYPDFEVQVDLPSREEASQLAERFRAEGLLAIRRWRVVLVGAADLDDAEALADRIRDEVPQASSVTVQGTWPAVFGRLYMGPASPGPW